MVVSHCYIYHETGGMIVVFTEILSQEMQNLFPAPRKALDETCHLARSYLELL